MHWCGGGCPKRMRGHHRAVSWGAVGVQWGRSGGAVGAQWGCSGPAEPHLMAGFANRITFPAFYIPVVAWLGLDAIAQALQGPYHTISYWDAIALALQGPYGGWHGGFRGPWGVRGDPSLLLCSSSHCPFCPLLSPVAPLSLERRPSEQKRACPWPGGPPGLPHCSRQQYRPAAPMLLRPYTAVQDRNKMCSSSHAYTAVHGMLLGLCCVA